VSLFNVVQPKRTSRLSREWNGSAVDFRAPAFFLVVLGVISAIFAASVWLTLPARGGTIQISNGKRVIVGHVVQGANVAEPPGYYPANADVAKDR
jgi:hypothetical protein